MGELLKYGGSGMVESSVAGGGCAKEQEWREGLIVNLFKKGDKEEPGI